MPRNNSPRPGGLYNAPGVFIQFAGRNLPVEKYAIAAAAEIAAVNLLNQARGTGANMGSPPDGPGGLENLVETFLEFGSIQAAALVNAYKAPGPGIDGDTAREYQAAGENALGIFNSPEAPGKLITEIRIQETNRGAPYTLGELIAGDGPALGKMGTLCNTLETALGIPPPVFDTDNPEKGQGKLKHRGKAPGLVWYAANIGDLQRKALYADCNEKSTGKQPVTMNRGGKKFTDYIIITTDTGAGKLSGPITHFDESVLDAVSSICNGKQISVQNPVTFTAADIGRILTGRGSGDISGPYKKDICESIRALGSRRIQIDFAAEGAARGLAPIKFGGGAAWVMTERALLSYNTETVEEGGQRVKLYSVIQCPPLLEYCRATKNLTYYPAKIRAIEQAPGRAAPLTSQRTIILDYLCKQYGLHSAPGPGTYTISFKSLYAETGGDFNAATKGQLRAMRVFLEQVFTTWEQKGYIAGWKWTYSGREIIGVQVEKSQSKA